MTLVVLLLLVAGGVLTAFLFPRDVKVHIPSMNTTSNNWFISVNNTAGEVVKLGVKVRVRTCYIEQAPEVEWLVVTLQMALLSINSNLIIYTCRMSFLTSVSVHILSPVPYRHA